MPIETQSIATENQILTPDAVGETLTRGLQGKFTQARVLVLIPDHTRSIPLKLLFPLLVDTLYDTAQLDFMIALGTHPPLSDERINQLLGITETERTTRYRHIGLLNHRWEDPNTFITIGTLHQSEIKQIAGEVWHPSLGGDVDIRINRAVLEYDQIIILGPTFPHEVVGFSGGAKYLFPGISGTEMIGVTHWLGALSTIQHVIGIKDTPIRAMIHRAAEMVPTPITLISLVVVGKELAGMFIGDHSSAWQAAADLSSERHIQWVDRPFVQALSCPSMMYDELWTAAKAMYKLEPAMVDGGEIIVYAPHLDTVSDVHGKHIFEVGYHVRDYYLKQWERFHHIPLGVLAHGTHFKGVGTYEDGIESPRIQVTLASKISREDCNRLNLGYRDWREIDVDTWMNQQDENSVYVPNAGETLYRVKPS